MIMNIFNILGLQSTSSVCPCYLCVVWLNDLRNRIRYTGAKCQTVELIDEQAKIVQASRTVKEMKKKAQQNESVFEKRIWNIEFQHICAHILHIILGITKKFWHYDLWSSCLEWKNLKHSCDMLQYYKSDREEKKKIIETRQKIIEDNYNHAKNEYSEAML